MGLLLLLRANAPASADSLLVTNTHDSGPGSLRQCLLDSSSGDTITFDPAVFPPGSPATIALTAALPVIMTGNLTIDGSSAGVILDGNGTPAGSNGLVIDGASYVVIKGLQILNFPDTGVVLRNGASNNTIGGVNGTPGGACTGDCNLISGNNDTGVSINGTSTISNTVSGNYIGTDASGAAAIPNDGGGVSIWDQASNNTVGGDTAGERNLISGNGSTGVSIDNAGTVSNTVSGNFIGTDASGTMVIGNRNPGVTISDGAQFNLIGGINASPGSACSGQCNLISGNDYFGVRLGDGNNNIVSGNYIGTDVSGTGDLGNELNGIHVAESYDNVIGGETPGAGNLIAFNGDHGVMIAPGSDNTIRSNSIFANEGHGVMIMSGTGNAIRSNSIFTNAWLGIDLNSNGVTQNDAGDIDTGSNNLQNFPVVTSAQTYSGNTVIEVSFDSTPNTTFTFEFFTNTACDRSNHGEGASFLLSTSQATDSNGQASFSILTPTPVPDGQFITATTTDPNGNTSEFSQCVLAQDLDGTVGTSGGEVVDTAGSGATFSAGPNVISVIINVFIQVLSDPGVTPPPGFIQLTTGFVNVTLAPNPSPLPAPGTTIILPLVISLSPGTELNLFKYDPASSTLMDMHIIGTVDPGGASATFNGVTSFSTFVAAQKGNVYLPIIKKKN